jgi:hypothetical protein
MHCSAVYCCHKVGKDGYKIISTVNPSDGALYNHYAVWSVRNNIGLRWTRRVECTIGWLRFSAWNFHLQMRLELLKNKVY